jgi:hypothetical protein
MPHLTPEERTFALPLTGALVALSGPFPVSAEQWQQLMTVLDAMKPGLVRGAMPAQPLEPSRWSSPPPQGGDLRHNPARLDRIRTDLPA